MSEGPYHWRDFAADERKADKIRALLNMPNLDFEHAITEVSAVVDDPPTVENQDKLKRMGCELHTNPLMGTTIAFPHHKHVSDVGLNAMRKLWYLLTLISMFAFIRLIRDARRSEHFFMF